MDKREFEAWIDSRLDSFAQVLPEKRRPWVNMNACLLDRKNYLLNYATNYIGNFFIVCNLVTRETTIFNTVTKRFATAKCRIGEPFSARIGVAIAWAKYNHEVVPDYEDTINREDLMNGDKFISSMNQNIIYTFIGWIPNVRKGLIGKWAIALDEKNKPLKVQIADTVIKR